MPPLTPRWGLVKPWGLCFEATRPERCGGLGQVAQSVEQGIENPRVGGSIPSLATTFLLVLSTGMVAACGDNCEQLCQQTTTRIGQCKSDSLAWQDLGARSSRDFFQQCRDDWEQVRNGLTSSDLNVALDVCQDTTVVLQDMSCDEILALYRDQ